MLPLFFLLLFILVLNGLPLFTALGGSALALLSSEIMATSPDAPLLHELMTAFMDPLGDLTMNDMLLPIPLFALGGYILAHAGTPQRIFALSALPFHFFGGKVPAWAIGAFALVTLFFFTPMTGASGVTIVALGGLLLPALNKAGYSEKKALGVITAGGSLGLLLFPSLPVILYGILSMNKAPINELFQAGIVPALLLLIAAMGLNAALIGRGQTSGNALRAENKAEPWKTLLEIAIIPVIFALFMSGKITPAEMSVIFVAYFLLLEVVVFKEIKYRSLPAIFEEAASLIGGILLIVFFAISMTKALTMLGIPELLFEFISSVVSTKIGFLLLLNIFLLIAGALMDIFSAIVVLSPLVIHVAQGYGIDMVHLGIIFLTNLEIGYITPPVGINLFITSFRFKKPLTSVYSSVWPYVLLLIGCQLLITYLPELSLWWR